jgi:hypothetical protein
MPKKPKPEPDDTEQSQRFVETARKLEVDESGKSFERAISATLSKKPDQLLLAKPSSRKPVAP